MTTYYTHRDFVNDFPNEKTCLEYIFNKQYPNGYVNEETGEVQPVYFIESRKCFATADGKHQIYPTAGTIFHKSSTPLQDWFYVIYMMVQSRCGVSAKHVQRELHVTYKTAWRMCNKIRKALECEKGSLFEGTIEIDETYHGGAWRNTHRSAKRNKKQPLKRGRGTLKTPIVGIVERDGRVRAMVTDNIKKSTVFPFILSNVKQGSTIYTDEFYLYRNLPTLNYKHETIYHRNDEYVRNDVHTNTIEGFWSFLKNGIRGAYKHVSKKYLQSYVNEYSFKWSHRGDQKEMFMSLLNLSSFRIQ